MRAWLTVWTLASSILLLGCSAPLPSRRGPAVTPGHGLSLDQRSALLSLRTDVAVPDAPSFDLTGFEVEAEPSAYYKLSYRNPRDGRCFDVTGATGGFEGPSLPIVSLPVSLRNLPTDRPIRLYEAADDPLSTSAQNWGPGTILSEQIQLRGITVTFGSSNARPGCSPLALRSASRVFARLRLLRDLTTDSQ